MLETITRTLYIERLSSYTATTSFCFIEKVAKRRDELMQSRSREDDSSSYISVIEVICLTDC